MAMTVIVRVSLQSRPKHNGYKEVHDALTDYGSGPLVKLPRNTHVFSATDASDSDVLDALGRLNSALKNNPSVVDFLSVTLTRTEASPSVGDDDSDAPESEPKPLNWKVDPPAELPDFKVIEEK